MLSRARPFNAYCRIDEVNFPGPWQHYQLPINSTPVSENANRCTGQPSGLLSYGRPWSSSEGMSIASFRGIRSFKMMTVGSWAKAKIRPHCSVKAEAARMVLGLCHCSDHTVMTNASVFLHRGLSFSYPCRSHLTKCKCVISACTMPWQISASSLFCFQL